MIGCLLEEEVGKPNTAQLFSDLSPQREKQNASTAFAKHCRGDRMIYHPYQDTFESVGALLTITLGQQE